MRTFLKVLCTVIAVCGATTALAQRPAAKPQAQSGARQTATVKGVASVQQLMLAMTVPASTALFKAAADSPKGDNEWLALQNDAIVLTESGNLLMIGGRAKDQADWMKMARAMVDAGAATVAAAEARNADALSTAGDQVYATCESCHDKYMDKSGKK